MRLPSGNFKKENCFFFLPAREKCVWFKIRQIHGRFLCPFLVAQVLPQARESNRTRCITFPRPITYPHNKMEK